MKDLINMLNRIKEYRHAVDLAEDYAEENGLVISYSRTEKASVIVCGKDSKVIIRAECNHCDFEVDEVEL